MSTKLTRRKFISARALAERAPLSRVRTSSRSGADSGSQSPRRHSRPQLQRPPQRRLLVAAKPAVELILARGEHPRSRSCGAPAHVATSRATGAKLTFQPVPDADWLAKQKVWMATKQVPDIMRSAFAEIRDFAIRTSSSPCRR